MGRTKRKRRKKSESLAVSLENVESVIDLKRWMKHQGWINDTHLQLKEYSNTGRGVTSTKNIHENDVLIRVPSNLLITFETILSSNVKNVLSRTPLKMHDYLSLFLILECHKGDDSKWKDYIKSLPAEAPNLPWLSSPDVIEFLPQEIREAASRRRSDFKESWLRVKQSIKVDWTCTHCNADVDCVISLNIFRWAYVLVNSRAVYFDPQAIRKVCDYSEDMISDEPSMALCPYLDMFNHSFTAETNAGIVDCQGQLFYELKTLSSYNRYEQIFISYGPHDNTKLLFEYGFSIPDNPFDSVIYSFDKVVKVLDILFEQRQYRYLKEHNLIKDLFVTDSGASFNLKALLFVANNKQIRDYSEFIYSDYDCHYLSGILTHYLRTLLNCTVKNYVTDLEKFKDNVKNSDRNEIIMGYLHNRLVIAKKYLTMFSE